MRIQLNTDNHIKGSDELAGHVENVVGSALERYGDQVTRVEVYLNDLNSHKSGIDKRCLLEVRLGGMPVITATHDAGTLDEAIDGATDKIERLIDTALDRRGKDHKGHTPMGGDAVI